MSTQITYIGHATVEIASGDKTLITDPVFSQRIFWIKRRSPLPMDPGSIHQPAAILISHAHFDHLDLPSLKYFKLDVPIILPQGLGRLVSKFVKNPIIEIPHGESHQLTPDIRITAFPVTHFGFRFCPLRYNSCNGYIIEMNGTQIFFPGDTAYRDDFKNRIPSPGIDIALLPISCYQPEWLMKGRHIGPDQALKIFTDIGAKHFIPIHWGTFKLSTEPFHEPIEWLQRLAAEQGLTDQVHILQPGEKFQQV